MEGWPRQPLPAHLHPFWVLRHARTTGATRRRQRHAVVFFTKLFSVIGAGKKKVKKGSRAAGAVGESIPCIATLHQADEARDALRLKLSLKRSAACGIEQ